MQLFLKFIPLFSLIFMTTLALCSSPAMAGEMLTAEPPKDEAFRKELKKDLSSLNITIEASDKDLGNNLNKLIPKELYNGATTSKGVTALILRNGPIMVNAADNFLYLTVPISISLRYGMFETPALANKLKFKLNASVTPDWKIITTVFYLGVSDLLPESIGIGPLSLKPRSVVDSITQPVQRILSEIVTKKLNAQFQLKSQVAKIWNRSQKPILLDKSYSAWLQISPREIQLYPFSAQQGVVKLSVGLKSFAELVIGPEPAAAVPQPLPNLKQGSGADKTFRVALTTDIYYKDLLAIALPLLLNKELGSDGKSIILKSLDIYGNGEQLIIKLEATGSIEGLFYLNCKPVFNPQTNQFSVEEVDFDMQTRSLLLRSADWFLHGTIRNRIKEKLNMDLSQRLEQGHAMANKALSQVKLADNIYLSGKVSTIKLNDVLVQKDLISLQITSEGNSAITLK